MRSRYDAWRKQKERTEIGRLEYYKIGVKRWYLQLMQVRSIDTFLKIKKKNNKERNNKNINKKKIEKHGEWYVR